MTSRVQILIQNVPNKALQRTVATGKISCGKKSKIFAQKRGIPLAINRLAAPELRRWAKIKNN
jgi:hypothetical protein